MMSAAHELQYAPASAARSQDLHFAFAMTEALVGRVRILRYLFRPSPHKA